MLSPVFKSWFVLVSFCVAAFPVYAQMRDTSKIGSDRITSPKQQHSPASSVPSSRKTPAIVQNPILEIDTEEDSLDSEITQEEQLYDPILQPQPGIEKPDQAPDKEDYLKGVKDGKRAAKGKPIWIFAGLAGTGPCVLFGVGGIGLAFTVPYTPSEEAIMGKSSLYIVGYYKGYRSMVRLKNAGWATLGLAIAIAIDIALDFPTSFGDFSIPMN